MHCPTPDRAHRHRHTPTLAAVLCLLAACGGGGTTTPGANPPIVASTVITGNVGNGSGAPVVNATVSLGNTSGTPATTQTDTSGNFTLPVATSTINTGTAVVVTVAKDGFKACTGTLNLATSTVAGCETLALALADEIHPAPADAILVRLGDGEAAGTVNSKLQIAPPFGLVKTIRLGWPVNFNLSAFQTLTLRMNIRAMESFGCLDKITVLQGGDATTATQVQVFSAATNTLADSDPLGGFSPYALAVPTAFLNATGGDLYVKLEAGLCTGAPPNDPSDDYEFVGLYGKFT